MMSEFCRNSISESLRRTIDDIKEISGQHSDEDIYEMLKDCNMDPNETAQKLLYLDTFHEVKRKRDRRKLQPGTRGGPNQYSSYKSNAVGGRKPNLRQEKCYSSSPIRRDSKYKETNKAPTNTAGCSTRVSNETSPSLSPHQNIQGLAKDTNHDDTSKRLPSLRPLSLKQFPNVDPGPTPTPTAAAAAKTQGSQVGNSVGLYSSATDPVLVPSLNPRNPGSVGIIKRETGNQRSSTETSGNSNTLDDRNSMVFGQVVTGSVDLVERSQAESSRLPSSTSHQTAAAKANKETCSLQQDEAPPKEMSEGADVASQSNPDSMPTVEDPISEQSTSEADTKQHQLQNSVRQSVIFPNYLHVPEAFKNSLTFGSLEASLGQNDSCPGDASVGTNTEISKEPSVMPQSSSSITRCSDYPDRPPSPSQVRVNLNSSQNASSATPQRHDQSKPEMLQPPAPPSMPDYGLNFIPPVVGQLEGLETQGGNSVIPSSSTPSVTTQPRGVSQSSIAVSPRMFPFIRQAYPPNYIPYSPYFSQLYMPPPQNPHQLLSHTGFPHQPSPTNMYIPPPPASSGVKFPVPTVYKPGNVAPNVSHYGISSAYNSYGTSGLGYGPSSPLPPQPCGNDDIAGPEVKDKNAYSTVQQNEDLHALACGSGRDPAALQTNVMYNLPQAQAMAFQAAHNSYPGIYHPSQSMPTQSLVQPAHQPQPTGAALEPTVPPLASYSQPQPQLLPLPQQQYGQMNWNQKFMNIENV